MRSRLPVENRSMVIGGMEEWSWKMEKSEIKLCLFSKDCEGIAVLNGVGEGLVRAGDGVAGSRPRHHRRLPLHYKEIVTVRRCTIRTSSPPTMMMPPSSPLIISDLDLRAGGSRRTRLDGTTF
ncbi:hypothetical protein L6452_22395 [Arctium lappa]|uniref:Uncharacterized protein n=1 Tax=Arctium lappa TaxID=4217 RepID=A0ACB9B1F1_ARCLA|nr:hypothetical protein L6452_22395 [Arctium lappa]